jgi:hypothetical protein
VDRGQLVTLFLESGLERQKGGSGVDRGRPIARREEVRPLLSIGKTDLEKGL